MIILPILILYVYYIPVGIIRSTRHGRVLRRRRNQDADIGSIRRQPEQTDSDRPAGRLALCGRTIRCRLALRGRTVRRRLTLRGRIALRGREVRSHPLRRRPICCSGFAVRLSLLRLLHLPVRCQDLGFSVHSYLLPMN